MGYQLPIHEASDIIVSAMRAAGENLNADFSHVYSKPGNQGFYTEIADLGIKRKSGSDIGADYIFNLNFPYDYFNDAELNIDNRLGIKITDDCEVKAEIRCMDLITKTYERWLPDHEVFLSRDLVPILNDALYRLLKLKHLNFSVAGNKQEIAEKYIEIWLTENHIDKVGGSFTDRFFPVEVHLREYYDDVGNNPVDRLIGEGKLRGRPKKEICLLRVAYIIYKECLGFLHNKWPKVYNDYMNGKF